jgi:predicted O-methyltransferase YrrM
MELHVISNWFTGHSKKREYFETHADKSLFPIVDFEKKTIKANKLHKVILSLGNTFEEKMSILKKYIGAYVSTEVGSVERQIPKIQVVGFKVTPSLAVVPKFMHDWYTRKTREALEGAIQYYKPKTVVELGVWYGASTVGLLQAAKYKIHYYGFDFFTPTATNPDYVTMSPMDKLFMEHFRLETAVANVAPYSKKHDIHFIFQDVMTSHEALKKLNVNPDLLFIDAVKDTGDLVKIIDTYQKLNPDIVIVGDDYMFQSVKNAAKKYPDVTVFGDSAYIITNKEIPDVFPEPVSDFSEYPRLVLSQAEKNKIPKAYHGYF